MSVGWRLNQRHHRLGVRFETPTRNRNATGPLTPDVLRMTCMTASSAVFSALLDIVLSLLY